jgi:hypothetical protein
MRTIILVPIIHTEHDMGSMLEQTKQAYVSRYGQQKWVEHLKSIDEVWSGIRQMITVLELPYPLVRLYQDGLPICGKEADIVNDVAAQGSKNHQLLLDLISKGSRLMGTEDPRLLLQEYQLHQGALHDAKLDSESRFRKQSNKLLQDRDHFIAERINSTLLAGEIGLLFLGLAHSVETTLNPDILVRHLLPSLRERQGTIA